MGKAKPETIGEYIEQFPKETRKLLRTMRALIHKTAPQAEEKISYGMPTFYLFGNLVHFAAYKNHIGFYPNPSGLNKFKNDILKYKNSKGAVQFPIDKPLPLALIRKIVKFRMRENLTKAQAKKGKK